MTDHDQTIPEDVRPLAERLERAGNADRAAGANVAARVAMRTAHLLREGGAAAEAPAPAWRRLWVLLAAPAALAAAAALIVVAVVQPWVAQEREPGVEVLAANLEHDIDRWLEIESRWREDSFENELTVLSLDAAGVAMRTDDLGALPALEGGL